MKRNNALAWLGIILACGLAVGACQKKSAGKMVLRVTGWGDSEEEKILDQVISGFKQAHPGVEIQFERAPYDQYITKVLTQFSAGLAPDVMAVNAEQMIAFASRGIFVDLNPYLAKDPTLKASDFYPEALDHYTLDGKLTALPRDIAPVATIYYNKKAFDAAGIPYPTNDWDYEKFLFTAQQLTKKGPGGKTTQFGFVDAYPTWDAWVYAFGGSMVDDAKKPTRCTLDSAEAIAGAQFRGDLVTKYHVCPSQADYTAMGGLGNSDLFVNGSAAMFYSGIWMTPLFRHIKDFDWDVVEFPKGPGGRRAFPMSAAAYGIVNTCENQDLAYELVTYLAGIPGQTYMAKTGLTQPALKTLAHSPVFLDGQDPKSKGFLVDAVKNGHFQPIDPNVTEWYNLVGSALDRVWSGDTTAAEALKKVTAEINTKFYPKGSSQSTAGGSK